MLRVNTLEFAELEYQDESVLIKMMYFAPSSVVLALNPEIDDSLIQKAKDIGDVIAQKNKERYEAVAKMPAYATVISNRRAEVEHMLDDADMNELRLSA